MPLRTFRDAEGVEWTVWDVHPELRDRRSGQDRRDAPAPLPVIERRAVPERRRRAGGRWSGLPAALVGGWLVFSAGHAQRRLIPIPPSWEAADEGELSRLCENAKPVPRRP